MKATRIIEPHRVETASLADPEPAAGQVVIRVMACGVCGTDVHILRGEYLGDYPVIPGHEFSGVVERVGGGVTRFRPGQRVAVEPNVSCQNCRACLSNRENFCENWLAIGVTEPGGMAQLVAVPEPAVFDIGDLAFERAAFVEPLSCVLHGVERARPSAGDTVALLGAGPIGILLMQVARLHGALSLTVVEANAPRRDFAERAGADRVLESLDDLESDRYDLVIDATGAVGVMARTLEFARPGGTVLLFGVPPAGQQMQIEPFVIFRKGLTVLSSFTSLRNSYQAVELLASGRIDVAHLVSHRLALEDFERGVETIEQVADGVMKVLITPNG